MLRAGTLLQRARIRFVNLAKQGPGRARQKSQGRAGRNFKEEQEEISPNHIQAIYGAPVFYRPDGDQGG